MSYELSVVNLDGKKVINFANRGKDFVEVVFTIDGKEVKEGKDWSPETKGYAYPPKLEKPVKKMKDGSPLRFSSRGGEVAAYIFVGDGQYKDEDVVKPAFLRHKLVDKIRFKRKSNQPDVVLKVEY